MANQTIEIYMLGRFRLVVGGKDIASLFAGSKKKLSLLEYLVLNQKKSVSVTELFETIWPEDENANPESSLKTLVSRLRATLAREGLERAIETRGGTYYWALPAYVDVFEFEEVCTAVKGVKELSVQTVRDYERILALYKGNLLPDSSTEAWVFSRSNYYREQYLKYAGEYARLLLASERFEDASRVCRVALNIDAFDSALNLGLMTALVKLGKNREALAQYEHTTQMHYAYLGEQPSEEILDFYKELIRVDNETDSNIDEIVSDLADGEEEGGAFVCEYAIFKDIYQLHMRNLKRMGASMFIVLTTLSTIDHEPFAPFVLDKLMRELLDCLKNNLRGGDTVSRFGPSQFAILLPMVDYDKGRIAMERVKNAFYRKCHNANFLLNYKLGPIGSTDFEPM